MLMSLMVQPEGSQTCLRYHQLFSPALVVDRVVVKLVLLSQMVGVGQFEDKKLDKL